MGTEEAAQNREQEQEAKEARRERVVGAHYGNWGRMWSQWSVEWGARSLAGSSTSRGCEGENGISDQENKEISGVGFSADLFIGGPERWSCQESQRGEPYQQAQILMRG